MTTKPVLKKILPLLMYYRVFVGDSLFGPTQSRCSSVVFVRGLG